MIFSGMASAVGESLIIEDVVLIDGTGRQPVEQISLAGSIKVTKEGLREVDMDVQKGIRALHGYLYADMVLLDADPLEDINNAKKVYLVIKNGSVIDRKKLNLSVNH